MYLARVPAPVKPFFRELVWEMPGEGRQVYLTFDDGPVPDDTPWVLDTLGAHGVKATFFCVGRNAEAHPDILDRIRAGGHSVGNHTWDHLDGWRTPTTTYLRDVLRCQALSGTDLFRPPYGRISRRQARALLPRFRVVMWDVLSGDFDKTIDGERCLHNVRRHVRPGSIVVFHDSLKARDRLRHALPGVLRWLASEGYACAALPQERAGLKA